MIGFEITGPDPLGMTDNELFAFMQHHAGTCDCAWCCDFDARLNSGNA